MVFKNLAGNFNPVIQKKPNGQNEKNATIFDAASCSTRPLLRPGATDK